MKIAFNPSTVAALTSPPNNKDITFDLKGHNIFARGVKFYGTDTNTWRPVVDNLTSDSTTSSLSAKQGKVLKALIDGKSNSGHTHDDRYLKLTGGTLTGNLTGTSATFSGRFHNSGDDEGIIIKPASNGYAGLTLGTHDGERSVFYFTKGNPFWRYNNGTNNLDIKHPKKAGTIALTSDIPTKGSWNYDDRYLRLSGGTMTSDALITFADSGSWGTDKGPQSARGGLKWSGQSDYVKLYAEETARDNLDLVIQFGDDNSNGLSIRNKSNIQTSYISANGVITTSTFKGNLDWSYITNKPSSYTPSAHTHAWNSLTHYSTTANQAILTNGSANGWKLYTLNISAWDNAANKAHSHANKAVLDGITSTHISNWNTAYTFVHTITGTDTDKVINKWDEIVNFLAGIDSSNKLNTLLNSKLSVYELADKTNVGTIKNNGIYYSTTDASSGTLTNSPFNNGFALINMTSYDGGDDLRRSRLAFNAYGEIKVSDDRGQSNTAETWYNVLTSKNSGISGSTIKLNGTSITVYSSGTADGRYVKKSGDTMSGALNFANGTWNLVGDDSYMGDCNVSGHFGIRAANTTYPGVAFFNKANAHLGSLTAYSGNIKYGAYSLQFLDNGNTRVSAGTWTNPFSAYDKDAVKDGQAICVWGQSSGLSNLTSDSGDMSLWLKRINAKAATLNMVLDGEYYANGTQRLAHVSEIPTALKNPYALTISLNGTSQGPYDGSAAKSINITPGSIGAATSGHNHDGRYVYNYGGTQMDGASRNKNALGMSTTSGISGDWWHILQAAWNDEYRWNSQIAFPTQNRNGMYYRSGLDDNTKWGAWVKLLDTGNSSISGNTITINGSSLTVSKSDHNHDYLVVNEADEKSFNSAYHNFQVLYAGGGNGITGRPDNVDAFGLIRLRAAWGWSGQMLLANGGSLYIRSSADAQMTNTLAWRTILDSSNYSSILDSRYYTESEIDTKLAKKLDRVNLTTGSWNPRSYNLAADYHYNGGDLSISETGGQIHVSVNGKFWQNEGQYRVLDTSDIAGIRGSVTLYQYLSSTNNNWFPLVWGGSDHKNTNNSTGSLYKSHDKLSWQTSSQTLYATNIRTENIKNLSIGGGIYWNPYVESATDGSDAASITLVKAGIAGGTTLILSQQNDASDTIQFKTSDAARLYHNSNLILTSKDTKVSSGKGYINNTEITQVNNSDTLDGEHATAFTRIKGRHSIYTSGTAPYNYIHLFRIANSSGYSTIDCEIDFRTRYHTAKLEIRVSTAQHPYNSEGTSISIIKKVINGRSCKFWVLPTVQSSGYNYYDIYYESGAWNSGSYGVIFKGSNGDLVFEHKGTNLDALPSNVSVVNNQWIVWDDIAEKPSTFNPAAHTHNWTSITDKIVAGNEFNIVSAGFKESMWFNYLPINDRSKTATISSYHFGNGARGHTSIVASGFVKDGSNSSYVLLGDGGHKTISSLSVNYANSAGSATSATKVIVNQHTANDTNYPLVWSNQANTSNVTENQLFKSWSDLYYNPKNKRLTVGGSVVSSSFVKSGGTNQQLLRADGGVAAFNWSGQSGQPTWLWGGNDFNSYYVYNPSNFRVAYAASAGNADTLDGEHAINFVRAGAIEAGDGDLNALDTYSFIKSVNSKVASHSPKSATGWYNIIQAVHRNGQADGASYIGQIALGMTTNTDDMFFRGKRTDSWKTVIHSGNIGSQTVANAYHLRINSANSWSTWNWSGQSGQPSWLWGSNDGTNMYVWNPSNFNVNTAQYLRSLGNKNCQTGRTQAYGDVYTYNTRDSNTGSATTYSSVIGFGRGTGGTVEIAGGWCNTNLYWRSLRDCCEDWFSWRTILDESNYASVLNNTYLPLAGGTMKGNARIGHGSGSLYIGNSGNDGWLYVQDMASQAGEANWKIYANGFATFKNLTVNGPTVVNGSTTLNSVTTLNGLVTNNRGILPASYDVNKNNTACYVWGDAMSTGVTAITDALDPKYVSIHYSNDNGSSWDTYYNNASNTIFNLYANNGTREYMSLGYEATANELAQVQKNQLMVTFEIPDNLYSQLCWASIDINNGVQTVCTVEIIGKNGTIKNTFTKNLYGWNNLNYINFWGNNGAIVSVGNDTARFVRFKFKHDAGNTYVRNAIIHKIRLFSFTKHSININDARWRMAYTGHLYKYDKDLKVTFPGAVTCNALEVDSTLSITRDTIAVRASNNISLKIGDTSIADYSSTYIDFNKLISLPVIGNANSFLASETYTTQDGSILIGQPYNDIVVKFKPGRRGQLFFMKIGKRGVARVYINAVNCRIIRADGFGVIVNSGARLKLYGDSISRFFIFNDIENCWYEFRCG